jgi:hypothetical protein
MREDFVVGHWREPEIRRNGGGGGSRTRVRRSEPKRHSMLSPSLISARRSKRDQTRRTCPELIFPAGPGDPTG